MPIMNQILPVFKWYGDRKTTKTLNAEILAGLTVGIVLVPRSMAYAQLAGLDPYYGL